MDSVKLFVAYNNRNKLLKSDILTPIQAGRAIADEIFDDMIGDDTDDNISYLNPKYCELSAIYWVWKNYDKIGNPDKVGFMHYRRHFLFCEKDYKLNKNGLVDFDEINDDYLKNDLGDDNLIQEIVDKYDVIAPKGYDLIKYNNCKSVYQQYEYSHYISHYDYAMKVLEKKYPNYIEIAKKYNHGHIGYYLNMFVMKKEIFFDYCKWLFSILFDVDNNIDYNMTNIAYQKRTLGFIGERLSGIYLSKLIEDGYNVHYLDVSIVKNVPYINKNFSFQRENEVTVALASSDNYVPYLSVFLQSLKEHTSSDFYYDVNILESDITTHNKSILLRQMQAENIQLHFINTTHLLHNYTYLCDDKHYSVDTYARLFICDLLPNKNKCLYLDIDAIVLDDVQKLFNIPLEDYCLAASKDSIMSAIYHFEPNKMRNYFKDILKIDNHESYFQNGVLILNLEKLRKINALNGLLDLMPNNKFAYADQCLFNSYFNNRVKYFSCEWNYEIYHRVAKKAGFISFMDKEIAKEYLQASKNPKIIHFAGVFKPWIYLDEQYADIWWNYARKSPYYEQIIDNLSRNNYQTTENEKNIKQYPFNILKYWKYKFLVNFVFGKNKKRYIQKRTFYKEKIRCVKQLLR